MSIAAGVGALEKQFYAYAFTAYAALIRDVYKNGFRAFVAILPCETGALQASASLTSVLPAATGGTLSTGHGSAAPIFGWKKPPRGVQPGGIVSMPVRVSYDSIPSPEQVRVKVAMPSTEAIAQSLMRSNTKRVTATVLASRNSYDEPEMATYSQERGYGDYSVTALHAANIAANYTRGFEKQFSYLSKTMPVDIETVRKLAK